MNGLVDGNTVTGAEDAGIYVGMSDNIDVTNNITYGNVMGIEFENTCNALMADNPIYGNSSGITLTLIPGLPVKDAYAMIIRDNLVEDYNLANFAPASSVAATVLSGVGVLILGADQVIIENNTFKNNKNVGILVADLTTFGMATDPKNDPYADETRIMGNVWVDNGVEPSGVIGGMVAAAKTTDIEVLSLGKGHGSCVLADDQVQTLGTKRWGACDESMSVANYQSAKVPGGADEHIYSAEQRGRLTYVAVCTGCHAYDSVLHGPSMQSIQAVYKDDIEALKAYVAAPVVKREGFPEMPPQAYLGDETLDAISDYILNTLSGS